MLAPAILSVSATQTPGTEAPAGQEAVNPTTDASTEAVDNTPAAPDATDADDTTDAPDVTDVDPAASDSTEADTTVPDGTGTDTTAAPAEGETTTPGTTAPTPTVVAPVLVDATANFKHDENAKYVAVLFGKDEQGQWVMLEGENVTDAEAKQPSIALFNPKNGSLHATFTLEMDEDGEWNITDQDYYNTKLHYLPIIIVTFFITLALSVIINIVLIKLHKR